MLRRSLPAPSPPRSWTPPDDGRHLGVACRLCLTPQTPGGPSTPTATPSPCCARTAGAPRRTPPRTSSPTSAPGCRVLDVGCGPGTITCDLADLVAPGRVTAVEPTEAALDLARAEAERRGHDQRRLRGRRRARPRPRRRVVRRGARPPGPPARGGPGAGAARDAAGLRAGRRRGRARQRLRRVHLVPRRSPARRPGSTLYRTAARANGGEPDAGRRLLSWAHAAGFTDVDGPVRAPGASPTPRTARGGAGCGPTASSAPTLTRQLLRDGLADQETLDGISEAFRHVGGRRRRVVRRAARRAALPRLRLRSRSGPSRRRP